VTFNRLAESDYFQNGIDAYLFDSNYGVYILSGKQLAFYVIGFAGSELNLLKYAHYNLSKESLKTVETEIVRLAGNVFLTDGANLYSVSVDTTHNN